MSRTLQILVGIVAIFGGITLLAMHVGEFRKHLQMQGDAVGRVGYITEMNIVGEKYEIHFEFTEPMKTKRYTGMSVIDGTSFRNVAVDSSTPIQYLKGNPEVNRHQFARDEIYARGRNVAIGALLVVIGLAVIARSFKSSNTATA